jgi:small subunit ribosomal protein S15
MSKQDIIKKFGANELDTGSSKVQIALLTHRIESLNEHFKTHFHDLAGKRGLKLLVEKRKKLSKYMQKHEADVYKELIKTLGLRK